ncbi:MAG: helix-turn-helix transcriptional regulator [Candidatus Margulisiibacteriota bacterium]|jgi:transcriptional regulator with XRE-family HTH domain
MNPQKRIRAPKDALILKKLAQRIIEFRKQKGISSEKLAYSIGLHKSSLNFIERCISDPKLTTLELIADGLDISLSELLAFSKEDTSL